MQEADPEQSLFARALTIPAWLEADAATAYAQRLHRDRSIVAEIGDTEPLSRVLRWWTRAGSARTLPPADRDWIARMVRARRVLSALLMVLGGIAGIAAALAVFRYDGTWPVNVVTVLATLVVLQIVLIALTLVLMLPRVPAVRALQDLLGALNPGALVAALYRRLRRAEDSRAALLVWHEARGPAAQRFARWQMLVWSQAAAVLFNVAVLVTAIALIAFTDLAFGWSTTLRLDAQAAHRITDVLSMPWQQLWPAAAPDAALVESSRFYRLASTPPSGVAASELTGWWPFLLACVLVYGLLPRLLLLAFAAQRLKAATRQLLLDDPRVRALLDRMNTAELQLGATDIENAPRDQARQAAPSPVLGSEALAIVWSKALPAESVAQWVQEHLQRRVSAAFMAGEGTLGEDAAIIGQIAARSPAAVLVLVRAWEAPLLDLQDFLAELRQGIGAQCPIVVVPVAHDLTRATPGQRATWSRWTARLADPALYLESGA